ncbi:MAG: ATP-dependent RecD-like DNA helicase [Verrucomicrobiota bacterium]|nr:ATP-binding domain-containing protein [Verrucomicrobiota bacterium]MCC6823647.1 ATP-binding domain-containing protein [Limisphaerales bacterium]
MTAALTDKRFIHAPRALRWREVVIRYDQREVVYDFGELDEISLAYAITIYRSPGSEFPAVVTPLATQQYPLLQRNLVDTGVTRGKKLVVLIGQRKASAIAVRNNETENRFSGFLVRRQQPRQNASG